MKTLLFLLTLFVLLWLLRSSWRRLRKPPVDSWPAADAEAPRPMLCCAQCGLHLPRDEALSGRGGVFCGDAHRASYERAHPEA